MGERHIVIVGGGLSGLASGCYALASGYKTTIVEHNVALGGVCTAWPRGPYVVDGCIHWLTGGAFQRLYEELGILPGVKLRTLEHWMTWRDAREGTMVQMTRDIAKLARDLRQLGPDDGAELDRLVEESLRFSEFDPGVDRPLEITSLGERLRRFWDMRHATGTVLHYRKALGTWAREHLRSESLRRFFTHTMGEDAPALWLLMVYGYLARGWLSRPVGGTAAFRDALVASYEQLGGQSILHETVDEILVDGGRASGVRLGDGNMLAADAVISTSSTPETVLRLLGGRYEAPAMRERLAQWKLFQPIVLASFGVEAPLSDLPGMFMVDGLAPFAIGETSSDRLHVRVCNDDCSFAPPGHSVVQALLGTDYKWWATRGTGYQAAKDEAARVALEQLERVIAGIAGRVRMTDIATPLTYWRQTRSWRGAYEGWMPNLDTMRGHVNKKLRGLEGLYLAGQWVEPGGGVPTAVMSGRQAVQILCADDARAFCTPHPGQGRPPPPAPSPRSDSSG